MRTVLAGIILKLRWKFRIIVLELYSSASHGAIDYLTGKVCFVYIGSGDL